MPVTRVTVHLPDHLWQAAQLLAKDEGDANTVIIRALEEYVTATRKRRRPKRPGKYQKLVKALSTPVSDLHLSARPASALTMLNIRYVYELVQKSPVALFRLPNFGEKSLREVREKLANLNLSLGMTLDEASYRASVLETVAENIRASKG